jgi:hypothetical protein
MAILFLLIPEFSTGLKIRLFLISVKASAILVVNFTKKTETSERL